MLKGFDFIGKSEKKIYVNFIQEIELRSLKFSPQLLTANKTSEGLLSRSANSEHTNNFYYSSLSCFTMKTKRTSLMCIQLSRFLIHSLQNSINRESRIANPQKRHEIHMKDAVSSSYANWLLRVFHEHFHGSFKIVVLLKPLGMEKIHRKLH